MLDLEHGVQPHGAVRDALDRLGLADAYDREAIRPQPRPTWSEMIAFFISTPTVTIEAAISKLIYQPFRIDALAVWSNQAIQSGQRIIPGIFRGNVAPVTTDDNFTSITPGAFNDLALALRYWPNNTPATLPVGLYVYDVPCRLVILQDNQSAATTNLGGAWTVTYMDPPYQEPQPSRCGGCNGL